MSDAGLTTGRKPPAAIPGIFGSRPAAVLFVASTVVMLAVYWWTYRMRSGFGVPQVAPIFYLLVARYDFYAAMCGVLLLIAAAFVPGRLPTGRLLEWIGARPLPLALGATVLCCLGTVFVYHDQRLSMDEYAQYFQSQVFATGQLAGRFPVDFLDALVPPPFQGQFLAVARGTGEVASIYWPSFALLLTPFTLLGVAWLCNAIITGVTVLVLHRIALRLFDDRASAGMVVLLLLASPVIFANGISYYSMPAHLLANALFALLLMEPTPRRLLLAGLCGSVALTLHNPFPHFLFALPWIVWLFVRPDRIRNLAWLALGYLPLSSLVGVGWPLYIASLQGDAGNVATAQSAPWYTLPTADILLARLMGLAKVVTWAVPVLLPLAVLGAWRARHDRFMVLFAASAATTLAGYLFVIFDSGHGWGFRYFHSAWLCLPLLAAAAMKKFEMTPASGAHAAEPAVRRFVVACALLSFVVGIPLRAEQMHQFTGDHLGQLPEPRPPGPRVVVVDPQFDLYGLDLVQNDPFLRGDEVRFLSYGPDANARLVGALRPGYERSAFTFRGEVWTPKVPAATTHP